MIVNVRLVTLAAIATVVVAQSSSQCVIACSQAALSSATNKSCKSITSTCVCTDVGFQTAAGQCLQKNCTTQDQQAAAQLQKLLCGNSTSSGSSNSTSGTNSTSSAYSSGSSTATGSAATASQSSAADAQILAGQTGLFVLSIAAASAIVGGLLI